MSAALLAILVPDARGLQSPSVDQSTLDAEFRETARAVLPVAQAVAGDTQGFLLRVQPYGSLDLLVLRGASPDHANKLRGFFLGVVGGIANVDPAPFADRWHCGPPCGDARRDSLRRYLPRIRELAEQFRGLSGVDVLAPWPGQGYRAGLLTYDGRLWHLDTPSPVMGFVPWRVTALPDSAAETFRQMHTNRRAVETLVAAMRGLGVCAIARNGAGGVRVVLQGAIEDNEAGLLFVGRGAAPPQLHGFEADGRQYVYVQAIASDVYFYVTS
jgi:hypothetical protein